MPATSLFSTHFLASLGPVQWLSLAATILFTYAVSRCVYLLRFHPASKFPGPKIAAVSNVYYAYQWLRGRYPWAVDELVKEYGEVVRIAPNELVFSTPQAAQDIYSPATKSQELWVKTDLMDFGAGDGGFIWEQDPAKRREVAKKVLPAFSSKAIKAKEPTIQKYMDMFIEKMKEFGNGPDGVDLGKWATWLAVDMSADLAYSREMHHLRDTKTSELLETLLGTNFFGTVMQVSKKFPLLSPFAVLFVPLRIIRLVPKFYKMNSEEVQKRIDNREKTTHPDFVDYMLPAGAPAPTTKKQKVHLEQVAMQLFIAGFDPIQLTFYSSIFFLLQNPASYANLVEEIRTSFQHYDDIAPDSLVDLPYLNAVIHETLRVHVANAGGMPRRSPGAMVDGHYIPEGVVCQISNRSIARNPRYFFDPATFRPERWLKAGHLKYDEKFSKDNLKGFAPFGLGPRACTGREIAWSQVRLFLAKVLWVFDLEFTRGQDKTFDRDFNVYVMWNKPDVWVKFKPR
ncbi:isotrichodermin C-15 hydroxylase [Hypoxylon sp. NC1633]|nr:isotrichodermin C-15 hydroxylase [Hypoxylon sp. NC1633]